MTDRLPPGSFVAMYWSSLYFSSAGPRSLMMSVAETARALMSSLESLSQVQRSGGCVVACAPVMTSGSCVMCG